MPDDFDYIHDLDLDEDDEEAEAELNCGSRRSGQCDLAGTEYCDWSCPLASLVFRRHGA